MFRRGPKMSGDVPKTSEDVTKSSVLHENGNTKEH